MKNLVVDDSAVIILQPCISCRIKQIHTDKTENIFFKIAFYDISAGYFGPQFSFDSNSYQSILNFRSISIHYTL